MFEADFDRDYLVNLSEAYQHYFAHYDGGAPLLVLDNSDLDYATSDEVLEGVYQEIVRLADSNREAI